jgi:hypothetical protein
MMMGYKTDRFLRILLAVLAVYGLAISALVFALSWPKPIQRAVLCMAWGLILLWCIGVGMASVIFRQRIQRIIEPIKLGWPVKFVLFCTVMALVEEAVTVTMTNMAPVFGVEVGQAYITASANYLDVVCLHSVVVFVPMFICWAVLLRRIDYSPMEVMFLFGLTGTLAEMSFGGLQALASVGFWMFVYGWMVFLPAYCLPQRAGTHRPRWWQYPLAVLLPFVFVIPFAGAVHFLHPIKIHFPPIAG